MGSQFSPPMDALQEVSDHDRRKKIIKSKVGLLKLAEQLGNVSRACKVLGYSAERIFDPALRQAFLERVPMNREIVAAVQAISTTGRSHPNVAGLLFIASIV